tara:strand:+ start:185 stop:352 length:168 start_codon:yes stop_codon:yes gene_type:complete
MEEEKKYVFRTKMATVTNKEEIISSMDANAWPLHSEKKVKHYGKEYTELTFRREV